jgi:RNA polymerase sigma factor (sigma-70 family)
MTRDAPAANVSMTLEVFVEENYAYFVRSLLFIGADLETALDCVQSSMVEVVRNWSRIQATEYPRAYVYRIVVRVYGRHRRMRRPIDLFASGEAPDTPELDRSAEYETRALLGALPVRQRQVIVLRYYLGMSENEIAQSLRCSPGTVKSRAARGLARLRELHNLDES